jgi:hypothetical protein
MNIITGVASVLVGGGLLAFIQFLISRHDSKYDKFKGITDAIQKLSDKVDELGATGDKRNAVSMRVRILRFADEMMEGRKHSKDSFDQCLSDIDEYEAYCEDHPGFRNNQTTATVKYIKRNYNERLEKHDFL